EADIGDGLQLQADVDFLSGLPFECEPGGFAFRGGEGGVAEPASAAPGDDQPGPVADQVRDHFPVQGGHHGAVGDRQDQVGAARPGTVASLPGSTVLRLAVRAALVLQQGCGVAVDLQDHVPTVAAVTAV